MVTKKDKFLDAAQKFLERGSLDKALGEFHVPVKLHREVTAHLKVNVLREEDAAAE